MNTYIAGKPVVAQVSVEVQGGETLTSLALPRASPHISPLLTLLAS
jgi:hypothetical protein